MLQQTHGFRHICPEGVRALQRDVLSGDNIMFLLHQSGPTGFVIKEQKRRLPVKVHLGDWHTCSCTNFRIKSELCLHLCWTLLKKLKFPPEDPRSFQLGLASHDLSDHLVVDKPAAPPPAVSARRRDAKRRPGDEQAAVVEAAAATRRRLVTSSDTCPICLEELLEKKAPVSHCRHGCGNAVHLGCMRVVAHHQLLDVPVDLRANSMLSCPLCRGDFCTSAQLAEESRNAPDVGVVRTTAKARLRAKAVNAVHANVSCACCSASPVVGVLYRCATCPDVRMCSPCARDPRISRLHAAHGLVAKKKPEDNWQRVSEEEVEVTRAAGARRKHAGNGCAAPAGREAGTSPGHAKRCDGDAADEHVSAEDLRTARIREGSKLLLPGQQCLLCLEPYKMKQTVGRLPCGHHFHARCLCEWLRTSASCPLDGTPVRTRPGLGLTGGDADSETTTLPGRASRSPASLCVRRLDLAERRDGSRSARSTSPRPSYLLHDGDVWTDIEDDAKSRHAALPARPLGGQQRLHGGHPRRSVQTGARPPEEQGRRSPSFRAGGSQTHLNVRSLALPDDAAVGVVVPRRTSAKEGRRRGKLADLTSERMRGLDFLGASDVLDVVDVKCLRMRLAERKVPK